MSEELPPFPDHKGKKVRLIRKQNIDSPEYSIAIRVGNVHGVCIRNCVQSIKCQTFKNIETIVVDFGSTIENHRKLMQRIQPFDCTVYYCPTNEMWNTGISRNIGLRRATTEYVAVTGVDSILEPRVVEFVMNKHSEIPMSIIAICPSFLPRSFNIDNLVLPRDYPKLYETKRKYVPPSVGEFVSAPRSWFNKVRGYDERMPGYGPADQDLWDRSVRDKEIQSFARRKLDESQTEIYHQWHDYRTHANQEMGLKIWHGDKSLVKNRENWGIYP